MALKNDFAIFNRRQNILVRLHVLYDLIQSDNHLSAAVFEHIALKLDVRRVQESRLSLHLGIQMALQFLSLLYKPIDTVKAELGLALTIEDIFTEVKLCLVLPHLLNLLLQVAQLVQTHLQIIEEVCHLAVHEIQLIDVLLVKLSPIYFLRGFGMLLTALLEHTFRLLDLSLVDSDVLLEDLNFKDGLLDLFDIDILMYFGGHTDLAVARSNLTAA